jgi:hypothetical protein
LVVTNFRFLGWWLRRESSRAEDIIISLFLVMVGVVVEMVVEEVAVSSPRPPGIVPEEER